MICIPVTARSNSKAICELKEASKLADIVELRIDYIENPDLESLLKSKTGPIIVTNRPVNQGGMFKGSESDRIDLLKKAISLKADYVDIEHDCADKITETDDTQLIVSCHDFEGTPENILDIHRNLIKSGGNIAKLVTFAKDINDNFKIFKLLRETDFPTIAFCMGELGLISRILSPVFGGMLTFAALDEGKESAPGQLPIETCSNVYRVPVLNKNTEIFGLLGNPVGHSMGPYMHNGAFKENGVNGVYVPFKVEEVSLFMGAVKEFGIKGVSVTIPHKKRVMEFLDEIDPVAKKIGAVNTVVNRNGKLSGYNTDCPAAINALERVMAESDKQSASLKDCNVVVLGAGGAARAIAFGLKEKEANLTIINRTFDSAIDLAEEVGCYCVQYESIDNVEMDVLINTTSVGMYPDVSNSPVNSQLLKEGMVVFDIIYNPLETKLLQDAKSKGCITLNGVEMFVNQASLQFDLFTGSKAPVKLMEKIVNERLAK